MLTGHFRLRAWRPSAPPAPDPRFVADSRGIEFERGRPGQDAHTRVAFAATIYLVFGVWSLGLAFNGQPVLGAVCAFLWLEFGILSLRLAALAGGPVADPELAARVGAAVAEVRARAGCALPRISLRNDTRRVAAVVLRGKRPLLILSRDFGTSLTDQELRGIVAHELAHVALGDLAIARVVGLVTAIGVPAILFTGAALIGHQDVLGQPPLLGGLWSITAFAFAFAAAPWGRRRELRADAYAAGLTGNPNALVTALTKGREAAEQARRRIFGRPLLRWALLPVAWRLPTHPTLAQRTAHLQAWSPATSVDLRALTDAASRPTRGVTTAAWLTVLCGLGLVFATLLPWVTETDASVAYLSWTYAGVYSYGWLALVGGLVVSTVAALTGMRLQRDARVGLSLTALGLSWGCAGVIAARAHELVGLIGTDDGMFSYAPSAGIFVAAAVAALLVVASAGLAVCSLTQPRD